MDILGEVFDAKKNLFEYIVNRHGLSGWAKYWTSYRDFIGGYTLKYEFERVIDEIFEASMVHLHVQFASLLLKASFRNERNSIANTSN